MTSIVSIHNLYIMQDMKNIGVLLETSEKECKDFPKRIDVKARSLLLMALPNEHQLTFNQYVDAQSMFVAIKARFWNAIEARCSIRNWKARSITLRDKAPRSKDNRNWNQGSSSKAVRIEDASEKAMCAIDGGRLIGVNWHEDEIHAKHGSHG
ncbi:hypothetical protein Tco_0073407 [Tanacetum coccineum]